MKQNYENNKRRIQAFKLTADVKDDNGVVHHFFEGYEYIEIASLKWATCNVGAENETDGGLYFAWGETIGYKYANEKGFTWDDYKFGTRANVSKYSRDDGLTTLEAYDDAATQNMGRNWRTPTKEEFNSLLSATTKKWTRVNGVNGRLFTDKTDESKKLFFPAVGVCYNGSDFYVGSFGCYWSSSLDSDANNGRLLSFDNMVCDMGSNDRHFGFQVRGVIK